MRVYILRHGETDWNKLKRFQGQTDIPLNDYGRELARKTRDGLKDVPFDYAFSSPLIRAKETAEIVLEGHDVKIVCDDRLKEMAFGDYEGHTPTEVPGVFEVFFDDPENFKPANGETYYDLCNRTEAFIKEVLMPLSVREPEATVLVSAHGATNKSLFKFFKGLPMKEIWGGPFTKNCSTTLIELNGDKWEIVWENRYYYE